MRVTKSDISLELDCWVDELSPAQLAAYEKVANEHNAIKNALKSALSSNEGKELFAGQVFQAYSFKGKVLQDLKEATLPKKPPKAAEPTAESRARGRKRASNFVYLETSDEEEDDVPLAKRIAMAGKKVSSTAGSRTPQTASSKKSSPTGKASPLTLAKLGKQASTSKGSLSAKTEKNGQATSGVTTPTNFRPSEISSVGGLVIGNESKDGKDGKENGKEVKLQGKTFPSLVVLAKPWLKVKDMSATRNKLDSKVKLVLMLTPNKFTEWLIQEGLLKSEQKCTNHRNNELKLGVYSDASKFPYTGGYVWISECCPMRFVSVFHGSIFEGAPHPPSCILKLIYHWSCQTNIQNVVQWVKIDNVYIKGVYTWLRAVCTLAVHQKCKKLGGAEKFVEVGVISLGTTSQDGQQRQVKVEVLGVLDYAEKTIRLRAVEPVSDADRNYKKRFQTILEPLQRWVSKDSIISIDLTVDKMTLYSMGFKNIVQAAATDNTAKHNNSAVMDYLRRIVPRMFQNTLSLLSRQMIQQFLDELVWREQFGTYALQAFNNITSHIAEQTRMNTNETLTQRLYQVATNPFKDWSVLPANAKETPANMTPKRLKKPINDADYAPPPPEKLNTKQIKKEKEKESTPTPPIGKRRAAVAAAVAAAAAIADDHYRSHDKKSASNKQTSAASRSSSPKTALTKHQTSSSTTSASKKTLIDTKNIKKDKEENDGYKGLEELYYGVRDGMETYFECFPYDAASVAPINSEASKETSTDGENSQFAKTVECPICDATESFDSNEKLQTHLVSHITIDGKDHQFQCLFCLEKNASETVLSKHNQLMHPTETKTNSSTLYHCLICQLRFNSLLLLQTHLHKAHSLLELPYYCQACGYRSSSHRDVVRHFYDDHKNQNFLQCPFCLDIFRFAFKGQLKVSHITYYYMHLRQHVEKTDEQLRCAKCALSFVNKGALKQHAAHHHLSQLKNAQSVRILLNNSNLIAVPKVRTHHREPLPYVMQQKFGDFYAFIDGSVCAECNSEIISEDHFIGSLKCFKCNYKTNCERAMFEHSGVCMGNNGIKDGMELPLPNEMHCICGFSTASGNKMADHLTVCAQKTAYLRHETAQENIVKRNMLDMLGLMRRDGESSVEGDEVTAATSSAVSDDQHIDADQQFSGLQSAAAPLVAETTESDKSEQEPQLQKPAEEQSSMELHAPIQFGEMEAVPVRVIVDDPNSQKQSELQPHEQPPAEQTSHYDEVADGQEQPPFQLTFGQQPNLDQHPQSALNTADIDMPLIGELTDPNRPNTPQFLGEVHTPMFDADAAAEQQHYHQIMQQQQNNQ